MVDPTTDYQVYGDQRHGVTGDANYDPENSMIQLQRSEDLASRKVPDSLWLYLDEIFRNSEHLHPRQYAEELWRRCAEQKEPGLMLDLDEMFVVVHTFLNPLHRAYFSLGVARNDPELLEKCLIVQQKIVKATVYDEELEQDFPSSGLPDRLLGLGSQSWRWHLRGSPPDILLVLLHLGRFQEVLDFITHWTHPKVTSNHQSCVLTNHLAAWERGEQDHGDPATRLILRMEAFSLPENALPSLCSLVVVKLAWLEEEQREQQQRRNRLHAFLLGCLPRLGSPVAVLAGARPVVHRISYFLGVESRRAEEREAWSNVEELVQQIHGISPDMGLWLLAGSKASTGGDSMWSSIWENKYKRERSTYGPLIERFLPRVRNKIMELVTKVSEGENIN